jgi:sensor histidine kinase YesM
MDFFHKKNCEKTFVSKLPSYEFWSVITRFLLVSIVGIISMQLIVHILDLPDGKSPRLIDYVIIIVGYNLLSEVNILLDNLYERIMPIPEKLKLRLVVHSFVGVILIVAFYYGIRSFFPQRQEIPKDVFYIAIAMGLLFVNGISARLILIRLMDKWVYAQKRIDEMKQEKLKMDYTVLQNQLNPHFLFNNLSVLQSLIMYDQETAVHFTQNFTDIYRYVLKSKDHFLVNLKDEIQFIETYVALHKERLGEGMEVYVSIDKQHLEKQVAPLSLQLLIENAIKHNVAARDRVLNIKIYSDGENLVVSNNVQAKESLYSSHTGLENLRKRYELLGNDKIIIEKDDKQYKVSIPLLEKQNR